MVKWYHIIATPNFFHKVARFLIPISAFICSICFIFGLYHALIVSPADYQQGETVRIMYVHVPAAYMANILYMVIFFMSLFYLIWRHVLADLLAQIIAPIGLIFTIICLVTGSLWGKPMWGTWWVWDARLTSVFVLFLIYCGYILMRHSFDNTSRARLMASILALFGGINLPIIKFSVDWWHTLHQPASLITFDGPKIDSSMLTPLLLMMAAYSFFAIFIILHQTKSRLILASKK